MAVNHSLDDQGLVTLRGQKVDKMGKERAKKYNMLRGGFKNLSYGKSERKDPPLDYGV